MTIEATIAAPAASGSPLPAAPAPAAPHSPAPAATPASVAPAASHAAGAPAVDAAKYPIREDYAAALLAQKLAAIPMEPPADDAPALMPEVAEVAGAEQAAPAVDTPPLEAPAPEDAEPSAAAAEEPFLFEGEASVTPEALSQMVTDHPELGKLLAADARLKGQLYQTAREAAELKPYRALFPDLDAAQTAQAHAATWRDVRDTFSGATTREGTLASLTRMAELCYERDAEGQVVIRHGGPVIGEDFYGFVNNVVALDLEQRVQDVSARLQANQYRHEEDRVRDQRVHDALALLRDDGTAAVAEPENLRRKAAELDRRERALNARQHGERVEERRSFESSLQQEATTRIRNGVVSMIAHVEKQGGVVSPYLKELLPQAIGAKVAERIKANPALQEQMDSLQRLPVGDTSRQRRLAAIDRAVQQYLPEVARAELRAAGVQIAQASAALRAKVDAQLDGTLKTEPKGSTGPANGGGHMAPDAAFQHAQAEWERAHPGHPFDKPAREAILPRVLALMIGRGNST